MMNEADLAADFETTPLLTGLGGFAMDGVMAALALARASGGAGTSAGNPDGVEWTIISNSHFSGLRAVALIGRPVPQAELQEEAA